MINNNYSQQQQRPTVLFTKLKKSLQTKWLVFVVVVVVVFVVVE